MICDNLSKREWLAGMALQGILSSLSTDRAIDEVIRSQSHNFDTPDEIIAQFAVRISGVLLEELAKEPQP